MSKMFSKFTDIRGLFPCDALLVFVCLYICNTEMFSVILYLFYMTIVVSTTHLRRKIKNM